MLGVALVSLTYSFDFGPTGIVILAEFLGLLLCIIPVLTSSTLRLAEKVLRTQEPDFGRPGPAHPVRTTSYRPHPPAWQRRNERIETQAKRREHG